MKEVIMPQKCIGCLGTPETKVAMSRSWTIGNQTHQITVEVPMCNACRKKHDISIAATYGVAMVLGVFLFHAFETDIGLAGEILVGAFLGGLVAFPLVQHVIQSVRISEEGVLEFRNESYQKLYEEANRQVRMNMTQGRF